MKHDRLLLHYISKLQSVITDSATAVFIYYYYRYLKEDMVDLLLDNQLFIRKN